MGSGFLWRALEPTATLQMETVNGVRYIDTPGLDDESRRQQAANEIKRALMRAGPQSTRRHHSPIAAGRVSTPSTLKDEHQPLKVFFHSGNNKHIAIKNSPMDLKLHTSLRKYLHIERSFQKPPFPPLLSFIPPHLIYFGFSYLREGLL